MIISLVVSISKNIVVGKNQLNINYETMLRTLDI